LNSPVDSTVFILNTLAYLTKTMKLPSIRFIALVLSAFLLLSACADPNDQYIQGTWDRSDIHILDYWVFDRGTYLHKSGVQLSNPNLQSGKYQVAESEEDRLVIELFPEESTSGFFLEPYDMLIMIDKQADTLRILRKTYTRSIP
jgi:hypothetical protein